MFWNCELGTGNFFSEVALTNETAASQEMRVVFGIEQIQQRIREVARQLATDYRGKTVYAVCVLEDGFIFMGDLVRHLDVPVTCQFIKPELQQLRSGATTEIFFSPEVDVKGGDVLLVQGMVDTGITSEFLMRNLVGRGAASVRLACLLDRQNARRIQLQPDYYCFQIDDRFVFGYGLGSPQLNRNLPHVATRGNNSSERK